ncbi:MAG: hypothetical protein M3Z66_00455 [Chloroflexota bacterium]|nr:hypothetical protein [Chloroflexota bacterium]
MQWKTETQLRAEYADVLGAEADTALIRVAQDLDAGLHAIEPPARLWSVAWRLPEAAAGSREGQPGGWMPQADQDRPLLPPPALAAGTPLGSDPSVRSVVRKWRMHTKLYAALAVAIATIIVAATSVTMAGSRQASLTDLGPPTNALPQGVPTGGFRRVKATLTSHSVPELLFIGTLVDDGSAAERWPVVKALNQFGTLSGVSPVVSRDCLYQVVAMVPQLQCLPTEEHGFITGLATFDWSHAVYHSRYLAFVHKDLIDQKLQMRAKLSPLERSLFSKYVALPGFNGYHDTVWHTAVDQHSVEGMLHLSHRFPLLAVGRAAETGNNVAIPGDLSDVSGRLILPFATVQQSLQKGHAQDHASPSLVSDYNAEANVLTAFICHADGLKPAQVCHRPVIKSILKSVK